MTATYVAWGVSAALLLLVAWGIGRATSSRSGLGILIDDRGRFSLTRLQIVLWTIIVLSLLSGVFWGRLIAGLAEAALEFEIPPELLVLLGISVGSTGVSTAIKASKDKTTPETIAASNEDQRPRWRQIFMVEQGAQADLVIDVTKYQNFWVTIILAVAYVSLAIATLSEAGTPADVSTLPPLSASMVTLLGISHAAYLAGKLPDRPGPTPGLTVALRAQGATPQTPGVAQTGPTYIPRP